MLNSVSRKNSTYYTESSQSMDYVSTRGDNLSAATYRIW